MPNNLDLLQQALGPITVTSGLRMPQHNADVGGVPNSAHLTPGEAYDFVPKGMSTADAASKLSKAGISFDQIIDEGNHVHVSFAPTLRGQVLIKGPMSQPGMSDDDLIAAITGKGGAPSSVSKPATPQAGLSDDQLIAALTGANTVKTKQAPFASSADPNRVPQSTLADVIRSIPGGLVKGAAGLAGLPGDINNLLSSASDKIMSATGMASDEDLAKMQQIRQGIPLQAPTSQSIGNTIAAPFGGFYEPKTTAGKFADTISQFAPAAVAPGNALLRASRVIAPGAASEAAGEATAGGPMEGPARVAGALLGAGGLGAVKSAIETPKVPLPTTSDIKAAASAAYKRAEQAGVVIKQDAVENLGKSIQQAVTDAGIDPTLHPKATAAVKRLTDSTGDLSLKQMDILRRVANGAAGSMDKDESRIAHIVLDHIDDFVQNMGPGDVLSGDTQAATSAIQDARSLWAKQAKSTVIDQLMDRAKNRAETVGGSGLENALRVEFRQLAQSPKRLGRFSPDEQDAIVQVARGGTLGNLARTVGKLAPTNLISILGEIGAYSVDPKALALPVAGTLGRIAATAATKRNALLASQLVRSGGKVIPKKPMSPEVLSGLLGQKQQQEQPQNQLVPSFAQ